LTLLSKEFDICKLNFASCNNLTDAALCFLSVALKKLVFLENISLTFTGDRYDRSCENITDTGLQKISQLLRSLSSLQRIHLGFNG